MNNNQTKPEKPSATFIEEVTFRYLPYWPLFAVLALIFFVAGWAYLTVIRIIVLVVYE